MDHHFDTLLFFEDKDDELALYDVLLEKMQAELGSFTIKVQKTQISFYNKYMFACVSFLRVHKKAELPPHYMIVSFGLGYPKESQRIIKTLAARNRWTHHIIVGSIDDMNSELLDCLKEAYDFSCNK